ncbi:MAG: MarR family transcriptional regulator [Paludibacterium sp.]|uniref:MarR family winged helix-turn-helix transcriptional regulator n=1 Tax=Paludibacterium sp. TaxID=1917523 RepID=UPI0025F48AE6|nr:MarR family transcriptional regulator [Paludibacterium sp.]MBV8046130.1 MarR family transcriptional regulator [Paludibacterium sp.]MBV8648804.1 MarR family transcriptional regulator [Paludibacterium sp.]
MNSTPDIADCASTLRKQMMLLVRRLRRESTPLELPLSQLLLLSRIEQLGDDATPTALAEYEGLRPQNLSALLRKLEQMGLTYKEENASDKRKSCVRLTAAGLGVLTSNRSNRDNWLTLAMTSTLTPDEVALLKQAGPLLERLAVALEPPRAERGK